MKIIKPSYAIESYISKDGTEELAFIERAARTCYKSEDKISEDSAKRIIKMLISRGHEAMLEHSSLTVRFICDRGISHELVRHRESSFAQESTRYCNYSNDKFGNEITVIEPPMFDPDSKNYTLWKLGCLADERIYFAMLENGAKPEEARTVLPTSLKTEVVVTANYREWRHILKLRTATDAHPQMRELMCPLLNELKEKIPVIFDDIKY